MRWPNTDVRGCSFSPEQIEAVWRKGRAMVGFDPASVRMDACGAPMKRWDYGQTSEFGWEIDHIKPVSLGGGDEINNLQPLHWQNNRHKADKWPNWTCAIVAAG